MSGTREIKSFAIYPSIGIARVGNSPDEHFFGPELPGQYPRDPDDYRDKSGCIKRQAARFRVYGLDADGRVVKEITAADARITWKVEVANKKAAWYEFQVALDIPAAAGQVAGVTPDPSALRNEGTDRAQLAITPPCVAISGVSVNAEGHDRAYAFDRGCFLGQQVYLGELRTDAEGRLIFLGGRGASASKDGPDAIAWGFENNDGWHDDVSDGPVDARVEYQGEHYEATGAWVVVAPPNFAPGIQGMVTGYDLILAASTARRPVKPSFFEHIYPLLRRLTAMQWVNAGFARDFGFGTPYDFESPELVARLNDPGERSSTLRHAIFKRFRQTTYPYMEPSALPSYYGDDMLAEPPMDPRQWMAVLDTQYGWLAQWAKGDFIPDEPRPERRWEQLDAAEQVRLIDRGVLEDTLGGPFHPGCEITWPMRHPMMYAAPFRIKRRQVPENPLPDPLTPDAALAPGGPLDGSCPGDITRWMAVPWQTDTASCLSGYDQTVDDYLPTFWPARAPNDVLSIEQYRALLDPEKPLEDKEQLFAYDARVKWLRTIVYAEGVFPPVTCNPLGANDFIREWPQIGIVVEKHGPASGPFPRSIWVETHRTLSTTERPLADKETLIPIAQHPRFRRK